MEEVRLGEQEEAKSLGVPRGYLMEEEHEEQKKPFRPQVSYKVYCVLSMVAWCLQKMMEVQISRRDTILFNR